MKENTRVAFFPCVYHEVDGVAKTGREFEAFASRHEIPFFTVHEGRRDLVTTAGPVTRVQRTRSPLKFPLDRAHDYDLLFGRHYRRLEPLLRGFQPGVVQITGPSDVGTLGAYVGLQDGNPARGFLANQYSSVRAKAYFGCGLVSSEGPWLGKWPTSRNAGVSRCSAILFRGCCLPRSRR
jgi:hypothetical protein